MVQNISKGLHDFHVSDHKTVCSNHFEFGKPSFASPVPTLYLTVSAQKKCSPRKSKLPIRQETEFEETTKISVPSHRDVGINCNIIDPISAGNLTFSQMTRERDVRYYTGMQFSAAFELVLEHLKPKAVVMHYWKGEKRARDMSRPKIEKYTRALSLCLMKLREGFHLEDLAFRFKVCGATISNIFTTWLKLMSKELTWLVLWPDRHVMHINLPEMLRNIIDCTEIFIETPSDLEVAAMCWSNYKQHYTVKFLVGITPNEAISYISDVYGGRASDIFIVQDCGYLNLLQPQDEVMADRGFKISDMLAFHQYTLTIPPSQHTKCK